MIDIIGSRVSDGYMVFANRGSGFRVEKAGMVFRSREGAEHYAKLCRGYFKWDSFIVRLRSSRRNLTRTVLT